MNDQHPSSTHPPLPPTTEEDRLSWLRLLRSRRVGVTTFYRLMAAHGSARAALEALPEVAAAAGVQKYSICPEGVIAAEARAARAAGAKLICRGEAAYPAQLADISDAPPLFWAVGNLMLLTRPMVALVGARNASSLGTRMARNLAAGLAERGCVVVSGLARGVDAAAHLGSLDNGTLAVQAGGVDVLYPAENAQLAEDIVTKGGLRLSEQAMGLQPQSRHFPARNRIISGLAQAVVVIEAAAKSGSLITARCALDQGRDVLAVPGHPMDARASGCNILIRDGARLIRNADDVMEAVSVATGDAVQQSELPFADDAPDRAVARATPKAVPPRRSLRETAELHAQILARLGPSPVAEDQLIRDLGGSSAAVSPALTDLEIDGRIERRPGGLLSLAT